MRMMKLLAIGMIALGTIGQAGWGQVGQPPSEQQLEWQRKNGERAIENRRKAQEMAAAQHARQLVETAPDEPFETVSLLDLNFAGGTLGQLVDALKQERPRANIMLIGEAGAMKIPPFEVFGVTPAGAILVAKNIADAGRDIQLDTVRARDGSAPTTLVSVKRVSADDFMPPAWANPSQAWNLRRWLGDDEQRIAATFAAIQVGLDTFGTQAVLLKYHEPTGVLMARGSEAQIDFIESIIIAASESSGPNAPPEVQQAPLVIARSSKRLAELEGEIAVLAAKADVLDARTIRLVEDKVGEETIAAQRVERAEIHARIRNLRFEEETLRAAVENAKQTLADYEAKSKR